MNRLTALTSPPEPSNTKLTHPPTPVLHLYYEYCCTWTGTANAVEAAEAFCGRDRFVMLNSDNFYPVAALKDLRTRGSGSGEGLPSFFLE